MKLQFLMIAEIEIDGPATPREAEAVAMQILDAYREVASTGSGGPFPVCLRRATDDAAAGFERNPPTVFVPPIIDEDPEPSGDRPCACDNCDWEGTESEVIPIPNVGDSRYFEVPAGWCPQCGAPAFLLIGKAKP